MSPDQQTLIATECATCGGPLPYSGVGRPRKFCDDCRPVWFPPLKQVNRSVSGESVAPLPRHRRTDPSTSVAAAECIPAGAVEARVLAMFRLFQALTDDELADQLPEHHPPTTKSARSRLSKAGVLFDSGMRRPSNRGRRMIVWELRA